MDHLKGKTVIVTGGGRGIGRAIVEAFTALQAKVIIAETNHLSTDINQYQSTDLRGYDAARELQAELSAQQHKVFAFQVDATVENDVSSLFQFALQQTGRVDVVVNAFGITHVSRVEDMKLEEFNAILSGNLTGVFLVCRSAIPYMRSAGGGSIINISSVAGKAGFAKVAHYCAAKFAIIGFTSALAREVADAGITVNAVCPGIVRTSMWEYLLGRFTRPGETREECWTRMLATIPGRSAQTGAQVADLVTFLAGARQITGQALNVDGGMIATP